MMKVSVCIQYTLVVFVSEISLVRFLIQKQLVCKYRTPALSMKYSLFSFRFLSEDWGEFENGAM